MNDAVTARDRPIRWAQNLAVVLGLCLAVIAALGFGHVNDDARVLVAAFSIIGVGSAIFAALMAQRGRRTATGIGFLLSAVTPTFFAWPFSLFGLIVGVMILCIRPRGVTQPVSHP